MRIKGKTLRALSECSPGFEAISFSSTPGGTYFLARGLREAGSDTIGVMTNSSVRQPGCEARLSVAVCMPGPGV
jgi:hypothetical protein